MSLNVTSKSAPICSAKRCEDALHNHDDVVASVHSLFFNGLAIVIRKKRI